MVAGRRQMMARTWAGDCIGASRPHHLIRFRKACSQHAWRWWKASMAYMGGSAEGGWSGEREGLAGAVALLGLYNY